MEFITTIKKSFKNSNLNLNLSKIDFDIRDKIKEEQAIMYDLLTILTYMASISTSDISRNKLFELSGNQSGITSKYLKRIHSLVNNYGYDYSNACKLIADTTKHQELRNFLIRFSNALNTGEEDEKFLRGEANRMVEIYTNNYLNDIESLKKWTDGYTALLISMGMVIAIFLISTMIFRIADTFSMIIATGSLFVFICFFGVYIIFRVAPYDTILHSIDIKSKKQNSLKNLSKIFLPAIIILPVMLLLLGVSTWFIFLCIAILMAPIGFISIIDLWDIEKKDTDIPYFLKNLGSTTGIMGTTLSISLSQIDKKAIAFLEELVIKLEKRLMNGIDPIICWYYFRGESGSELINKYTTVFIDAITLGGDATKIGEVTSQASLGIVLLRIKRKLVSTSFMNLIIPMHITITGLMLFIFQIMFIFTNALQEMMKHHADLMGGGATVMPPGMGFFNIVDLEMIRTYVLILIFILSIANASVIKFASGGSNWTVFFYGAILFFLSAMIILIVPPISEMVFTIEMGGGIQNV